MKRGLNSEQFLDYLVAKFKEEMAPTVHPEYFQTYWTFLNSAEIYQFALKEQLQDPS